MFYTEEDVFSYIEQEDVKFIRLTFCDFSGKQRNLSIMPHELKRAFSQGISFDASAIAGFGDMVESDLFLFPIPATFSECRGGPAAARWCVCSATFAIPMGGHFTSTAAICWRMP